MLHTKREVRGDLFKGMRPGEWRKAMSYEDELRKWGHLIRRKDWKRCVQ